MIVKELIEYLQTIDPELKVFVKGYEAGYNDANTVNHEELVLNVHSVWYYGKHDLLKYMEKKDKILNKESEHKSIKGIIIGYEENYISPR
jgi:hypothetical protein